ncbi:Gfo/Idh/MocA family protein [Kutzneria sp. CA-103260]|uniref:Gfo/Idh/MocA family protein n=1 Tax=Kutzneria sp. CA-103260 TaxID=2802641 RepID=UPI001BAB1646|nr:Gfo/Idh/MocA family oxidoreductase [Kutzneria sp. CA-103260]QUQ68559.1 NAD binding oxidoreductase [Kutzneria sp. CA-103260]
MPLDIGLIGATGIAEKAVLRPSAAFDDVTVRAVAASDPVRAKEFARRNGIDRVHGSYAELVADPGVNTVYVSLHNSAHREWVVAAAEAGKHVIVEKPLCLSAAECAEIAAAAAGVQVIEAVPTIGHPWAAAVREMITDGRYGPLTGIRTEIRFGVPVAGSYRERPELGGGIFLDSASYWLQAVQATVGLDGAVGSGRSAFDGAGGVDRSFDATLTWPDCTAELHCEVGDKHLANHEFIFAEASVRIRNFLLPAAGTLPLNLVIRRANGTKTVEAFPPVGYYDLQLARARDIVAGGSGELAAAIDRITLMAAIHRQAREAS